MIECRPNLTEYFRERLQGAAARQELTLAEPAEYYVVNLLSQFCDSEKLFVRDEAHLDDLPLAILLERAVHGATLAERIRLFKRLGDTALFMAGFFPARAQRRLVDLDYYVRMGGGAYFSLASCFREQDAFNEIFVELGDKFRACVNVLTDIAHADSTSAPVNLLELYERWLKTGSHQIEEMLKRAGIPTTRPDWSRE